ncbi:MAG TPA: type II toxin-antitoxin system VapB family antitoxin [Caulobacteraceae bacterium]|nr:type II toxin-antitoxin system VapB family antitoxin [Caulobacteraceae bacterium]
MSMFIKNPDVEQAARELARLRGTSLTEAVRQALEQALSAEREKPRPRPTVAEMKAATDRFRKAIGLDRRKLNVTKADFDALSEIPGFDPKDEFP